jgi:hypothetical protein
MKRFLSDYNPATNPDPVVVAAAAVVVEPETKPKS